MYVPRWQSEPLALLAAWLWPPTGVGVYVATGGPLSAELASQVDVMTAVLPYVPSDELHLLPPDVQRSSPEGR